MGRMARLMFVVAIVVALAAASIVPVAAKSENKGVWQSDSPAWIVRLQPGASIDDIAAQWLQGHDEFITQRYSQIVNGFAARMPTEFAEALRADSRVLAVMPDIEVYASAQTIPTGINRINAPQNATADIDGVDDRVDVDVAILDTGVATHPELNVAGGTDCTRSGTWTDGNGHGTHVAGTIGAIDDGAGVVGVAPGARIWSVRVLDARGRGYTSWILCGVDWVTAHASTIEVANMSLGGRSFYGDDNNCGLTNNDVLHQAICEAVAAGVTFVVAAGNDGFDAANNFPANYDEVITVSALVDTDGQAGGQGPASAYGADDRLASFSNYGPDVDVIAPGVNIVSTSRTGGYATMSGTSMATPHVAGAAALEMAANPTETPAEVRAALIDSGSTTTWSGDRDSTQEPLIDAGNLDGGSTPPPPPPPTDTIDAEAVSVSAPSSVGRGSSATVNVTVRNNGSDNATIPVTLTETPGGFTQTKSIALAAGASGIVAYTWATTLSTATGSHTLTATTSLADDGDAGNNTATATINVAAPASSSTMSVASLTLTGTPYGRYHRLTAQALIEANGVAVRSATVRVEFTYPNGARYGMSARTNASGIASFTRYSGFDGAYTVTVTSVTRSGMIYDPAGNVITTQSVTVP